MEQQPIDKVIVPVAFYTHAHVSIQPCMHNASKYIRACTVISAAMF